MYSAPVTRICCMSICLILIGGHGAIAAVQRKEFFSSIAGLEEILDTEAFLLTHLQSYVESMTSQLEMLKSEIVEIEKEHLSAAKDLEEYLTSPVNAYLLIKRLDKDWSIYEDAIKNDAAQKSFLEALAFSRQNLSYPTEDDATGSAVALVRLQETYQLDVSQVAAGILNGVKYGSSMTWQDCFQLGQQLFSLRDFNHTKPWFEESLKRLRSEDYYNTSETVEFMETLAHFHQQMGDFEKAMNLTNFVLQLDPKRDASLALKDYLDDMIAHGYSISNEVDEEDHPMKLYSETKEFKLYEKVCRGEIKPEPWQETPLRCRYFHRNVPYRLLMPFKLEEMNLDPYVIVLHDVLSDNEITPIKELSKPRMKRSEVRTIDGASTTITSYRTSQNTWLRYSIHPVLGKLIARLHDITGLDMTANEDLQVANYGIGGHYEPHFDFFESDLSFVPEEGNRIATAIFYLSDVEQGGATAFPFLQRAIQPKKGNVLFWYNLHESEEKDYRTKHAACPVLKGSKWIANVWIRVRKQEFRRPCGLQQDHEISLPYSYVQ